MNPNFNPGDRVRKRMTKKKGLVVDPLSSSVRVRWDGLNTTEEHPEILIKLKPKPKVEKKKAREYWLTIHPKFKAGNIYFNTPDGIDNDWEVVPVREVLPHETVVTEESLAKAWDKFLLGRNNVTSSQCDAAFNHICEYFGLSEGK